MRCYCCAYHLAEGRIRPVHLVVPHADIAIGGRPAGRVEFTVSFCSSVSHCAPSKNNNQCIHMCALVVPGSRRLLALVLFCLMSYVLSCHSCTHSHALYLLCSSSPMSCLRPLRTSVRSARERRCAHARGVDMRASNARLNIFSASHPWTTVPRTQYPLTSSSCRALASAANRCTTRAPHSTA